MQHSQRKTSYAFSFNPSIMECFSSNMPCDSDSDENINLEANNISDKNDEHDNDEENNEEEDNEEEEIEEEDKKDYEYDDKAKVFCSNYNYSYNAKSDDANNVNVDSNADNSNNNSSYDSSYDEYSVFTEFKNTNSNINNDNAIINNDENNKIKMTNYKTKVFFTFNPSTKECIAHRYASSLKTGNSDKTKKIINDVISDTFSSNHFDQSDLSKHLKEQKQQSIHSNHPDKSDLSLLNKYQMQQSNCSNHPDQSDLSKHLKEQKQQSIHSNHSDKSDLFLLNYDVLVNSELDNDKHENDEHDKNNDTFYIYNRNNGIYRSQKKSSYAFSFNPSTMECNSSKITCDSDSDEDIILETNNISDKNDEQDYDEHDNDEHDIVEFDSVEHGNVVQDYILLISDNINGMHNLLHTCELFLQLF